MKNILFVAWRSRDQNNEAWGPVGMLVHDVGVYRFCYTYGAEKLLGFQPFPGMDDLNKVYESEELFPLFSNRLLPRTRPEYEAFLRWGGFESGSQPDPITVLGITGGIRQTDSIEVFPCAIREEFCGYFNKFFLHGVSWMPPAAIERVNRLISGEKLSLMPDPCNHFDHNAVALRTDTERTLIGYVPRYLARDILHLLNNCEPDSIDLVVDRLNTDAPLQQKVLCRMRSCWPDNFKPCSGKEFRPIPKEMAGLCTA
ncbi:MAG: HIRAN domain-containing protein [Thermoguttaceae bacterium]|jgi:hypothetical protein